METLNILQSMVRAEISESDIGYLSKWLMKDYQNITKEEYIEKINSYLKDNFFDNNNKIRKVIERYSN